MHSVLPGVVAQLYDVNTNKYMSINKRTRIEVYRPRSWHGHLHKLVIQSTLFSYIAPTISIFYFILYGLEIMHKCYKSLAPSIELKLLGATPLYTTKYIWRVT